MLSHHIFSLAGGFCPNDIDHSVHLPSIQKRHCDAGQTVRMLAIVGSAYEGVITQSVASCTRFGQDPIKTLGVVSEPVFGLIGLSQHRNDLLTLSFGAVGEISPPNRRQYPVHRSADPIVQKKRKERRLYTT